MVHLKKDVELLRKATRPHVSRPQKSGEAVDAGLHWLQLAIFIGTALESHAYG